MVARPRLADAVRAACSASAARTRRSCAAGTDGDVTDDVIGAAAFCCALLPSAAQRLLALCAVRKPLISRPVQHTAPRMGRADGIRKDTALLQLP